MLKVTFSIVFTMLVSFSAAAEKYKYTCELVKNFDDWSVRVGERQADFFDNNTNCIMTRPVGGKANVFLSTRDCGSEQIRFTFDADKLKGELQLSEGVQFGKRTVRKFAMFCKKGAYQD